MARSKEVFPQQISYATRFLNQFSGASVNHVDHLRLKLLFFLPQSRKEE
jgi:hypothetical protein